MRIVALLVALMALISPVQAEEIETIPRQDHIMLVNARINGTGLGILMIDTGASYVVLSPRLAKALGLVGTESVQIQTPGQVMETQRVTLDSLQLGEIILYDVPAIIQPMDEEDPMLAGVVGMSALSRLSVGIKNNRLYLEKP